MSFAHKVAHLFFYKILMLVKENCCFWPFINFSKKRKKTDSDEDEDICGTPLYMAPEIIREKNYSNASDVYAFDMIVYDIVTKKRPFENEIYSFIDIIKTVAIEGKRQKMMFTNHIEI